MSKEVQVKNYKIKFAKKPLKLKKFYEIEIRAITEKDALEQAYSLLGSKHKLPRQLLVVKEIKAISDDELKSSILREIAKDDSIKIPTSNE